MVSPALQPSASIQQQITLSFEYPVLFSDDVLAPEDTSLAWAVSRLEPTRRHPLVICIDSGVAAARPDLEKKLQAYIEAHAATLSLRAELFVVPGGEAAKNDPTVVARLLERFAAAKLDRHACVLALGGGAVLDAVGYAAALLHRGVRLVRLPTTVLAQGDGGVGVKNGVNAFGAKNFLGCFAPPFAVVNCSSFLTSLPKRDLCAGLAEAVKVACIRDAQFFEWLEQNATRVTQPGPELKHAVRRCAELHLEHIRTGGDPFERGSARPLDFGHWAAHKLEVLSEHDLRHGEAVSIGMQLDAHYSQRAGLLPAPEFQRLVNLLRNLGLPRAHPSLLNAEGNELSVLKGIEEFREHLGGELTVTLLQRIGQGVEVHDLQTPLVNDAIRWLLSDAPGPSEE